MYKNKLPFSCRVQNFLSKLGIAIHNPFRNECTKDFGCCVKTIGKYWLRINQDTMEKFIHCKEPKNIYAARYSREVWSYLMKQFDKNSNFYIGANDVSDLILNTILNALNGQKDFIAPNSFECDKSTEYNEPFVE